MQVNTNKFWKISLKAWRAFQLREYVLVKPSVTLFHASFFPSSSSVEFPTVPLGSASILAISRFVMTRQRAKSISQYQGIKLKIEMPKEAQEIRLSSIRGEKQKVRNFVVFSREGAVCLSGMFLFNMQGDDENSGREFRKLHVLFSS